MVVRCGSSIIEVKILTGEQFDKLAIIPRISLSPSSDFPFHMTMRQFLVRLAYAMIINKSQGQSVKFVGVDLRTPVFSHGQLYVALSRYNELVVIEKSRSSKGTICLKIFSLDMFHVLLLDVSLRHASSLNFNLRVLNVRAVPSGTDIR
ncbi:uncharacterized protein LOC131321381 [Rhododendron vialii]|uniref:uncharacterized protein LOC131321381 n=1 Tax=Rhododendron vialii TaxID=182163 RepID=UPI00265FE119|nr:uncharacterized protein LOC131321381 [Rhododendron vialii]